MKQFKYLLPLFFITIFACDKTENKEEESNTPSGTYLTINGDTREIVSTGDSELRITKEIVQSPQWYDFDEEFKVIQLEIYDPNNALIANFGDYNYRDYLMIRFAVRNDFSGGSYKTTNDTKNLPAQNESIAVFLGLTQFIKISQIGQTFEIKNDGNKWILEFKDLKYDGDDNTATISGRIILNK
ncbi:hypothetical protein HZY62_21530 [Maribacter polysiphoniae]|uniref:Lipoprotein n=1 Tax=Maribacter polysiphoniae TaxID=429344 RepID=A0A316DK05_9FLAO|nr:hypothetical protein [Maribacter polysiphoniae]MBD1263183.1 hypothetical protein [Maribacter polysiphoniae]PWK18451.1 hypothetical protein LX92_04325 [Maribacter polysiphoniae]